MMSFSGSRRLCRVHLPDTEVVKLLWQHSRRFLALPSLFLWSKHLLSLPCVVASALLSRKVEVPVLRPCIKTGHVHLVCNLVFSRALFLKESAGEV